MNIFDFENKVRSASNKQRHDIDIEGLLGDLNLVDNSPRRRLAFLPYFGLMAIAVAGALMFYTYSDLTDNTVLSENALNTTTEVSAIATTQQLHQIESVEQVQSTNLADQARKITADKLNKNTEVSTKNNKVKKSVINSVKASTTRTNANTEQIKETIQSIEGIDKNINQTAVQQSSTADKKSNKIIASVDDQKQNTVVYQTVQRDQALAIDELPTLNLLLDDVGFAPVNKKVSECPKFSEGNWNLAIAGEVGILLPIKSLSLTDESARAIFDERGNNESSQLSYQTGVAIQFKNKITGLYIRPGFNYSIINETFSLETPSFISTEVKYQLHQFNIPVAFGSSFKKDKLSFDVEGGIIFNFLQKTNGRLFNGGEDFILLDGEQDFFKQSTGLGFFAGAAIKTRLNSRAELYFGSRFYINTLANSSNLNPIDQRYSFIGIHTGVIYTIK